MNKKIRPLMEKVDDRKNAIQNSTNFEFPEARNSKDFQGICLEKKVLQKKHTLSFKLPPAFYQKNGTGNEEVGGEKRCMKHA